MTAEYEARLVAERADEVRRFVDKLPEAPRNCQRVIIRFLFDDGHDIGLDLEIE